MLKVFALDKTSFAQLKSVFEHKRFYATHQIETEFLRNRENVSKQYYFYNRKRFVEKYKDLNSSIQQFINDFTFVIAGNEMLKNKLLSLKKIANEVSDSTEDFNNHLSEEEADVDIMNYFKMIVDNIDFSTTLEDKEYDNLKKEFEELFKNVLPTDPLKFVDSESYADRLKKAADKTGLEEAVITGVGKIEGHPIAIAVMDFDFMGGSMGSVVGEKVARIMEKALELRIPMLSITSSGGARMQESALSLMQMAKTSCAAGKLDEAGILFINLLTEPTFGGVTASFGTLGDIIIAEQGARIGFAGRRVIEQTIHQKLPSDFQTAEYLLKYGQVDIVSKRKNLRKTISNILEMHKG